ASRSWGRPKCGLAVKLELYRRRIYNAVLFPAIIFAFLYRGLTGGWASLWEGIAGLGAGVALLLPAYVAGGVGAGDVKLLGAVGACGGPEFALYTFLAGALLGWCGFLFPFSARETVMAGFEGSLYQLCASGWRAALAW
ncbi:A24 family peptidase, partial [Thermodesulfitimonas sp.]